MYLNLFNLFFHLLGKRSLWGGIGVFLLRIIRVGVGKFGSATATGIHGGKVADGLGHGLGDETVY
jgi:hypothetical protein